MENDCNNCGGGEGGAGRRYMCQISATNWRGLANLVLDSALYVGTGHLWVIRAQMRPEMMDKSDKGGYFEM